MAEVIERPCTSCGISLETGVKIVAVADVFSGCALVILWSVLLSVLQDNPPVEYLPEDWLSEEENQINQNAWETAQADWVLQVNLFIVLATFSVIQIILGFMLYIGQAKKNVPLLNTWLVISGFSIPANGLLIKIYEMIVVFSLTDEIKCEARAKALEEFRELPYVCVVKTQLYPGPRWEWDRDGRKHNCENDPAEQRDFSMGFYNVKSFLVNGTAETVFSAVHYHSC